MKENFKKQLPFVLGIVFIVLIYFVLRFYNLKQLPVFVDEAIYARWAQLGWYNASLRLVSLEDGKQPLFIWLTTLLMYVFPNPVSAGRVVSIFAGLLTMLGLYLISTKLFKNRLIGLLPIFLYAVFPFAVVLNRMALYESTVGMFYVFSLYLSLHLLEKKNLGSAFLLGFTIGAGLLSKSSGFISIYLLPLLGVLMRFTKERKNEIFKILWFFTLSILISLLIYCVLLLSDKFYMIREKDAIFTYHFRELLPYHAFNKWPENLISFLSWTITYFTFPIFVFIFAAFLNKQHQKEKLVLLTWCLVPLIALSLFSRLPNPRYLFPITLTLIPLASLGLVQIYNTLKLNKPLRAISLLIIFGPVIFADYKILTDFPRSPIPKEDKIQYANSSSSGEGMKEIIDYLRGEAQKGEIVIATEGTYGSLTTTLIDVYFTHTPTVEKFSFASKPKGLPNALFEKSLEKNVFIIFNETQTIKYQRLEQVMSIKRGETGPYLWLYRIMRP